MQGAAKERIPFHLWLGLWELPRGFRSRSAQLNSKTWRPRLPTDPGQSEPSRHRRREKSPCSFKNIRVQQTRAVHRGAQAGGAGFVNGVGREGGGERRGRGKGAGPARATQPRSSKPHTHRPRSPAA